MLAGRVGRDDDIAPALCQPFAQLSGIVGAVGDQARGGRHPAQNLAEADQIMGLARSEAERQGAAPVIRQGVNLGRPSAARSSDGVGIVPPFAPAAERWALMCVLSADVVPMTPLEPVRT